MSKYHFLGSRSISLCVLALLISAIAGCNNYSAPGGGGNAAISVSPNPLSFPAIAEGATSGPSAITVTNPGTTAVSISSVAFGGTNVADFTNKSTCNGSVAPMATCAINVSFAPVHSGMLSETVTVTQNGYAAPQMVTVNGTANPIVITLNPTAHAAMAAGQTMQFAAAGDPNGVAWSVAGFTNSGMATAAPAGMIDANGNFTPPAGSSIYAVVTATGKTDAANTATATVNVVAPGTFANTNNIQVAQYSVSAPSPANISVQFGLITTYNLTTWTVPTGALGGQPSTPLYVAGMKQTTPYHMRGVLQFTDGSSFNDADFTFTTGTLPAGAAPNLTVTTTPGMTPQPGVELLDLIVLGTPNGQAPIVFTDLSGSALWTYSPVLALGVLPNPIKLLPNGHLLMNFNGGSPDGVNSMVQEVDLGGNLIWQMTAAQLNTALAAATCAECNITVTGTHHDLVALPNGHVIVLAGTQQVISGTTVTGDVVIDLGDIENVGGNNPNHTPQPVWAWNEFNHLDINRRPYMFPDWTHTNAVIYSKDDGNLIISIRHQNWLVKIDYNNGAGAGDILWKLGAVLPGDTGADVADFTLLNSDGTPDTTATDWFFAQHGPSFTTSNTSGQFGLTLFDNGDDRGAAVASGGTCGVVNQPACFSTVPVFTIDETAKTATFVINPTTPDYSFFGGNAETLANGNLSFTECSNGSIAGNNNAKILEVTQISSPQTVWQMLVTGQDAYRGLRMGSLYPGVQW